MGTSLSDYSQTPASNDMANYFQTGMRPSAVKIAGWDVMADMCQQMGPGSLVTSGGTANAQTITNTRQVGTLYTGRIIEFYPGFTNTGAMTLQEDGLTAKNVTYGGSTALIAGMVVSGVISRCRYDGTQYQLINPQRSLISFTGTLTGMTGTITGTVNASIGQDGKTVFVFLNASITGTSNATSMTMTGVPASLTAAHDKLIPIYVLDNGAGGQGAIQGFNSTTWTFTKGTGFNGGGFTNTGTKGLNTGSPAVSYTLD